MRVADAVAREAYAVRMGAGTLSPVGIAGGTVCY